MSVGEIKSFYPYSSKFLAETLVIKDRLTRIKQTILLTYKSHVYMGDRKK